MPSRDGERRAKLAGSPRDYAAAEQGFAGGRRPGFVRSESEEYVHCGLLQRGFALVACKDCPERRLVAFSCGSRSFCPDCMGRRMVATTFRSPRTSPATCATLVCPPRCRPLLRPVGPHSGKAASSAAATECLPTRLKRSRSSPSPLRSSPASHSPRQQTGTRLPRDAKSHLFRVNNQDNCGAESQGVEKPTRGVPRPARFYDDPGRIDQWSPLSVNGTISAHR